VRDMIDQKGVPLSFHIFVVAGNLQWFSMAGVVAGVGGEWRRSE